MNIQLPRRQYVVRALAEMDQQDALLLRMRWGMEDGKPSQISFLAKYFNMPQIRVMEELKRAEFQVFKHARNLEDQYETSKT